MCLCLSVIGFLCVYCDCECVAVWEEACTGDHGAYVYMQLDLSPCLSHVTLQDMGCSAVWFCITVSFFGSPRVSAVFPSPSLLSAETITIGHLLCS